MTPHERVLLSGQATVFDPAQRIDGNPATLKSFPHLLEPSGIVVLIDDDMIVTGSLDEVYTFVRAGRICAYPDPPETRRRWFPEWHEVLELRAPLRRGVCVNAGFVAFSMDHWPDFLSRWWNVCKLVPPDEHFASGMPFNAGDQDVLNALLLSEIPREALVLLPEGEEVFGGRQGRGLRDARLHVGRATDEDPSLRRPPEALGAIGLAVAYAQLTQSL